MFLFYRLPKSPNQDSNKLLSDKNLRLFIKIVILEDTP